MSAKKKAASKSAPKSAVKKTATKKTAVRKTAVKKAQAGETASMKKPATKNLRPKPGSSEAAATPTNGVAEKQPTTPAEATSQAVAARRDRRETPAIFKVPSRRHPPIFFTLDDVREHLSNRKKEELEETTRAEAEAEATRTATRPAAVDASEPRSGKRSAASLEDILGLSGGPTQTYQRPVPKQWERYYELLTELRHSVKTGLMQHSNDTLKRSQKEDAGDISTSADAGTDNFDRDFALSLLANEQEALKEIEAAIRRIHEGTYGVCEITGEAISEERLEAVPFTRFSLEGQRQHESTSRRRLQRSGTVFAESSGEVSFGDDDGDN